MVVKVSRVAAEFRRVSNKQMADTTKRTIKENVSINSQLQKMSEKVLELIDDNENSKIKVFAYYFIRTLLKFLALNYFIFSLGHHVQTTCQLTGR